MKEIEKLFKDKEIYSKKEAIVAMVLLGCIMKNESSNDEYYYYLDDQFYKTGIYGSFDINTVNESKWKRI